MRQHIEAMKRSALAGVVAAAMVLALAGCGDLVRKVPGSSAVAPKSSEGAGVAVASPAPPAAAKGCRLQLFGTPVSVPAYSTEGISINAHVEIVGCPEHSYTIGAGGGQGTLKKVAGGDIRYYPPTRAADAAGTVGKDSIEVTVECPHGTRAKAMLPITILRPGQTAPEPGLSPSLKGGAATPRSAPATEGGDHSA